MLKPRQLHRRENGKERLYNALRALYLDGVRVCAGRRRQEAAEQSVSTPAKRETAKSTHLSLLDDTNRFGSDPYNTSRR